MRSISASVSLQAVNARRRLEEGAAAAGWHDCAASPSFAVRDGHALALLRRQVHRRHSEQPVGVDVERHLPLVSARSPPHLTPLCRPPFETETQCSALTSICGTPRGAGGMGARLKPPRRVLSRVN
jgi:hypothetical protein